MLYEVCIYLFLQWLNRTNWLWFQSIYLLVKPQLFYLVRGRLALFLLYVSSVHFLYIFLVLVILKLSIASRAMGELFQEANSISLLQTRKHDMKKLQ